MAISPTDATALLAIARGSIRAALQDRPVPPIDVAALSPLLAGTGGCFVSLHTLRGHRLRGCVGRIESTDSLAVAVQDAATKVLRDPRFVGDRVTEEELSDLDLEVSVLSPLRPSTAAEFDLLNDGIVLTIGGRSGCFLPQVARETGWTREHLLDRLCTEKLGLPPGAWAEAGAVLQRFAAEVVGPVPFEEPAGSAPPSASRT
ncbi:MAG TPA: AmmeMemoRadiSam system protein A [Tepidisphaeraceae bacterium]|nr:AmmeMemoRadiSam system protein A [Tepidisphaeraceae bacterium]